MALWPVLASAMTLSHERTSRCCVGLYPLPMHAAGWILAEQSSVRLPVAKTAGESSAHLLARRYVEYWPHPAAVARLG
jgi:hypothetical protein